MSNYFGNRCYGCYHYGGHKSWDNSKTMVQCRIGVNSTISQGCSNFTPDEVAHCMSCLYYYRSSDGQDGCSKGHYSGYNTPSITIDHCYDYKHKESEYTANSNRSSKSGCFVTTAVCDILGKDDKCFELEILRKFRDEELLTDKGLEKLVFEYYRISPRFVNKILTLEKNKEFAEFLLNEYINNIIENIQNAKKDKAIELYKKMLHVIDIK
jgi:hypothetical protein